MRDGRLVDLLLLLQTHARRTASQLAESLGVSERTVYRDLDALGAAGIPVYGIPGPGGGYGLVEGYHTRLTGITASEVEALMLLDPSNVLAALGLEDQLSAGRRKLVAALPAALRDRAQSVAGWVHVDLAGWFAETDLPPSLPVLAAALVAGRMVRFRYGSSGGEAERHVSPLGLVLKGRSWYLVATRGGRLLTYSAPRIRQPSVTTEPGRRPEGFSLSRAWPDLVAQFETGLPTFDVRLRATPRAAGRLRRAVDTRTRREIDWDAMARAEAPVELSVTFEHLDHARSELLPLGPLVEVLAPAELRDSLAAEARALAELYGWASVEPG